MKIFKAFAAAALAAAALCSGTPAIAQDGARTQQALSEGSVIETIKQRGALRVGLSTFVPWAMRDKQGELVGFEVDVATKLAADMEVDIELIPTAWDGIIPALLASKFDVIIGGLTITPVRNLTVNFTDPYANSSVGALANRKLAEGLQWPDEYNSPEVTIACRRGSTPCAWLKKNMPKASLRQFDDDGQVAQEVLNGNAHMMLASQPKPAFDIYENPETLFSPTDELIDPGNEGFAVRKGDPDALNFFNNWILVNKASGWLDERHAYWFGGRPWADQIPE